MSKSFQHTTPPKWPLRFLKFFVNKDYLEEIEGDMEEVFQDDLKAYSKKKAKMKYALETLKLLKPVLLKKVTGTHKLNNYGMVLHTFKTAYRTFFKQKMIAAISLLSLIIGLVCFHLIYVWVDNEISVDDFHRSRDNIYMSVVKSNPHSEFEPMSFSPFFNIDYDQFTHIKAITTIQVYDKNLIKLVSNNLEYQGKGFVVDSTFFNIFDFSLAYGAAKSILSDPNNIVLSQRFATKVFGDLNPIGQTVKIKCDNEAAYQVAGILKKIPSNSSIDFDFIIPKHSQNRWRKIPHQMFLVDDSFDLIDFNNKISKLGQSHRQFPESTLAVIPFSNIYFDHPFDLSLFAKYGNIDNIKTMAFVALMIILISLLSFVNLQTTLQLSGVKKMGIKQVIGASKFNLCAEMMVSRFYFLVLSVVISFLIFGFIFPFYTAIMEIQVDRFPWLDVLAIGSVASFIIGVSVLVSIFQIFKVETKEALRGKVAFFSIPKIQRALTTVQYIVTIILLITTSVVFSQFQFMLNKNTGLNPENIISVDFIDMQPRNSSNPNNAMSETEKCQFVMNEMLQNPDILSVSQGDMPISSMAHFASWKFMAIDNEYININSMTVDPEYAALLDIKTVNGRFFSKSQDKSRQQKVVINEAAAKYWGIKDITQAKIASSSWGKEANPFQVIGVIKDYHYEHLSNKIKPLILLYNPWKDDNFLIKTQTGKDQETLAFLENLYHEINPSGTFSYKILEEKVNAQYLKEKQTSKVYFIFTLVALLLSSIGLFTFALYETKRRTKEIGIRKVNGASISSVFSLLGISFLKSVLFAFVVACPIAYYIISQWLENFAYRTEMSWWIFGLSGLLAVVIAAIAISWQTWEVARKNPVESLRYE